MACYDAVLVGVGKFYVADVGVAFPDIDDDPAAGWTYLGETDGGVQVNSEQTLDLHRVDTESGPVKVTRSEESLMIIVNLAELTLANLSRALNNNVVTEAAGPPATRTLGMYRGLGAVGELALLFKGVGPYDGLPAQFEIPRAIFGGNLGLSFTKDSKTLIPVEFSALVDCDATSNDEKFGRIVAQFTPV
jgi:hypothetical protein